MGLLLLTYICVVQISTHEHLVTSANESVQVTLSLSKRPRPPTNSNMTKEQYLAAVDQTKEHIQAGDVFQLVLSQRFQRHTQADPFEIYRYIASVNPDWQ